ncbi:hypothetical protein BKL50_08375 [Rodentibacter pneumotropicus]|nr:hypothetical protein BKL50_08375 [Rodentibacter pneumotropicus]THA14749.1 hypothetical protein D3M83_10875 [Rodentibacter pneumotropicus]
MWYLKMSKSLSLMIQLSHLPISQQRRFINETKGELLEKRIPIYSSILPDYNKLDKREKMTFFVILMEYLEKDIVGKTLI